MTGAWGKVRHWGGKIEEPECFSNSRLAFLCCYSFFKSSMLSEALAYFEKWYMYRYTVSVEGSALTGDRVKRDDAPMLLLGHQVLYRLGRTDASLAVVEVLSKTTFGTDECPVNIMACKAVLRRDCTHPSVPISSEHALNISIGCTESGRLDDSMKYVDIAERLLQSELNSNALTAPLEFAPIQLQKGYIHALNGETEKAMTRFQTVLNIKDIDATNAVVAYNNICCIDRSSPHLLLPKIARLSAGSEAFLKRFPTAYGHRVISNALFDWVEKSDKQKATTRTFRSHLPKNCLPSGSDHILALGDVALAYSKDDMKECVTHLANIICSDASKNSVYGPMCLSFLLKCISKCWSKTKTIPIHIYRDILQKEISTDLAMICRHAAYGGLTDEVYRALQRGVDDPDPSTAFESRRTLGYAYYLNQMYDEAEQWWHRAFEISTDSHRLSTLSSCMLASLYGGGDCDEYIEEVKGMMKHRIRLTDCEEIEICEFPVSLMELCSTKHKSSKRKRKPRYPKGWDPAHPCPPPDPERWLPKHQRSTAGRRRRQPVKLSKKGPQGLTGADETRRGVPLTDNGQVTMNAQSTQHARKQKRRK
eukprot:GHVO01052659.1.p1 GENE.GHVO01052659.1~~GHVO01052659.1.p1  ORF type:complete len:607 (+),score=97.90 GHVO01052659.1:48-1823(+)